MTRGRLLAWVAVLSVLCGVLAVAVVDDGGPPTAEERARSLSQRFACPECQGQSVAESNAAVAVNIRQFIVKQVEAGRSDDEIERELVQAWDNRVTLAPPASGFGALAWVLPVVAFTGGATAVAWVLTRDRSRVPGVPSDEDRELVERARSAP